MIALIFTASKVKKQKRIQTPFLSPQEKSQIKESAGLVSVRNSILGAGYKV
jgi:hypothetical protein